MLDLAALEIKTRAYNSFNGYIFHHNNKSMQYSHITIGTL